MDLFVLRHGRAEQHSPSGDAGRPLTGRGREEIKVLANWLASADYRFNVIATSPLERAKETAEIIARVLGQEKSFEVWEILATGSNPDDICRKVAQQGEDERVIIIGHEPALSALVSRIITGGENAGVVMAKGGLAKIRNFSFHRRPSGELQWLISPKILMRENLRK